MSAADKSFILPYEPNYTGHRDAEHRRRQIRKFVKTRETAVQPSPPVAPDERDMIDPESRSGKPSRDRS